MTSHRLTFITPLFCKGSYDDQPEIRPPSIRGQLHWWFRALGGNYADENAIFGGVHGGPVASKIVVRVGGIHDGKNEAPQKAELPTLPHKSGGNSSPKWAFKPTTTFDLHLTERLGGLTDAQHQAFRRTLEAWLLAGTLGLRATRAGGSFTWQPLTADAIPMPATPEDYAKRLTEVFRDAPLQVRLLRQSFQTAEEARKCISDTIGGPGGASDWQPLDQIHWPLGNVKAGQQKQVVPNAPQRKTSPLRFRIVQLGPLFYIVVAWDNRTAVTGNRPEDHQAIAKLLQDRGKNIGHALAAFHA